MSYQKIKAMKKVTIEQLAEKLNGKLWIKGDMKRLYLDEGHNTKKMSTKTYVYEREDGTFGVSCYVECANQPRQWCKSQEDEIIENVKTKIDCALSDTVYIMTNKEGQPIDWRSEVVTLNWATYTLTEAEAEKELDNCYYFDKYITMPRAEFEAEVDRLEELERPERERIQAERRAQAAAEEAARAEKIALSKSVQKITNQVKETKPEQKNVPSEGKQVKHNRFGVGTVLSEDNRVIEVYFGEMHGVKKLAKEYANLEVL